MAVRDRLDDVSGSKDGGKGHQVQELGQPLEVGKGRKQILP